MGEVSHRRRKPISERRHVHDTRALASLEHGAHFRRREAERFLAHDVLTPGGGCLGNRSVSVVRCRDHNRVDIVRLANLFETRGQSVDPPLNATLVQELGTRVTRRDKSASAIEPYSRNVMVIADCAAADQGDSNWRNIRFGHDGAFLSRRTIGPLPAKSD
jgi:hypothetical protein